MKRTIAVLLLLVCLLTLFSCEDETCQNHTDTDKNGVCDTCGVTVVTPDCSHIDENCDNKCDKCGDVFYAPIKIPLIDGGVSNFSFVLGQNTPYEVRVYINELVYALDDIGIEVDVVEDRANTITGTEVLIGNVTSRGEEYIYDSYSLGKDGHAIIGRGTKVMVLGGSAESLLFAIDLFTTDVLGFINGETTEIESAVFEENIFEPVTEYKITSLSVDGRSLLGYTIATDRSNADFNAAANALQDAIYSYTGYYLPVVSLSSADKSIILEKVYAGDKGFSITTSGNGNLLVKCDYPNKLLNAINEFLNEYIKFAEGDVHFEESFLYEKNVSVVTYEEFGAVGNGYTDDSEAIKKAHLFANAGGQTVVAKEGARYLVKELTSQIPIRTNVIWTGATFKIDMRGIKKDDPRNAGFFRIDSDYKAFTLTGSDILKLFPSGKIDKENFNSNTFNWPYNYSAMVVPLNSNHKNYIRSSGGGKGADQMELFYVDKDGNISENTPLLFDYEEITSVLIMRCDDRPITIDGGTFITYAPDYQLSAGGVYMGRGIRVMRSNVTLTSIKHIVYEVEDDGNMYPASSGFIFVEDASDVILKDCVLVGRKKYYDGTYDLQCYRSNNVLLQGCTQSNFYVDDAKTVPSMHGDVYWGIMGSSYCKNITFDSCMLSRFDAHAGVYNGKIINSTINAVEIIGGGTMLIENTKFVLSKGHLIDLRTDYGSTWRGEIIIKDCNVVSYSPANSSILRASWLKRSFGYTTYMPNLIVDNLKYDNVEGRINVMNLSTKTQGVEYRDDSINAETLLDGTENPNPYQPFSSVKIINNHEGYDFVLYDLPIYKDVKLEGCTRVPLE